MGTSIRSEHLANTVRPEGAILAGLVLPRKWRLKGRGSLGLVIPGIHGRLEIYDPRIDRLLHFATPSQGWNRLLTLSGCPRERYCRLRAMQWVVLEESFGQKLTNVCALSANKKTPPVPVHRRRLSKSIEQQLDFW